MPHTDSTIGKVISLFNSSESSTARIQKSTLHLDEFGILEDKFYNKNINRSVLITSEASYLLAKELDIQLSFGALGENILMDCNLYHLNTGDQIQIAQVILEISQNCTICDHLSNIDIRLPELLKEDRGIFARVIQGGGIKEGDKIVLLG